jgi:hypothetical protein
VTFLLDTGWGISILTLVACALVIGATTLAATAALAVLVYAVRFAGRLSGR